MCNACVCMCTIYILQTASDISQNKKLLRKLFFVSSIKINFFSSSSSYSRKIGSDGRKIDTHRQADSSEYTWNLLIVNLYYRCWGKAVSQTQTYKFMSNLKEKKSINNQHISEEVREEFFVFTLKENFQCIFQR